MKAQIEDMPLADRGIDVTSESEEEKQHLERLWTRSAAAVMLTRNDDKSVTLTFGPTEKE